MDVVMFKLDSKKEENVILITTFLYSLLIFVISLVEMFIEYSLVSILQIGLCLAFIVLYFLGYQLKNKGKVKAHFANSWVIGIQVALTMLIQHTLPELIGINGGESYSLLFYVCGLIISILSLVCWICVLLLEKKLTKNKSN